MAKLFDRAVRAGLNALKKAESGPRKVYREKTFSTGVPFVDLTKANQLAAELEDEERLTKMQLGK